MVADAQRVCAALRNDFRLPCMMATLLGGKEILADVSSARRKSCWRTR